MRLCLCFVAFGALRSNPSGCDYRGASANWLPTVPQPLSVIILFISRLWCIDDNKQLMMTLTLPEHNCGSDADCWLGIPWNCVCFDCVELRCVLHTHMVDLRLHRERIV